MPSLRGLKLLDTIDVYGPLTVTEIAQVTGVDKSWVSRLVAACEPDGWVIRENGRIALGPRAALLAQSTPADELIRRSQPLVEAIAGVTGLLAQAYGLVGSHATVLAAAGSGLPSLSLGVNMSTSLVATAAGQVIAAQLEPAKLERVLPQEPFPDPLGELSANPGYVAFAAGRFAPAMAVANSARVGSGRSRAAAPTARTGARRTALRSMPATCIRRSPALPCRGPARASPRHSSAWERRPRSRRRRSARVQCWRRPLHRPRPVRMSWLPRLPHAITVWRHSHR